MSSRGGELVTLPLGAFPKNAPSIFISYVAPKLTKSFITKAIQDMWGIPSSVKIEWPSEEEEEAAAAGAADEGEVGEDDWVTESKKKKGGRAYVTMDTWYRTPIAREARLGLLRSEMVKLQLSNGYYFKCFILIDRHGI
jgi:hypothetical protein